MIAIVLYSAISSLISAWKRNYNPYTTEKAAKITGTYPTNSEKSLKPEFFYSISQKEQERLNKRMERIQQHINISAQIIIIDEKTYAKTGQVAQLYCLMRSLSLNLLYLLIIGCCKIGRNFNE